MIWMFQALQNFRHKQLKKTRYYPHLSCNNTAQLVAFLEKNHMKSILQKLETESMEDYDPTIPSKEVEVPVDDVTEAVEETQAKEPVDPASLIPEGVTVVRDRETAERIQQQLRTMTDRYHACDTEAIDVDINRSPVGQGKVSDSSSDF